MQVLHCNVLWILILRTQKLPGHVTYTTSYCRLGHTSNCRLSGYDAMRCQRTYFTEVVFLLFCWRHNLWGHWTDLNQTWTHTHLWLRFEKFSPNSPGHLPHWLGAKTLFGLTVNFDQTFSATERNLSIYRDSPTHPLIWWTLIQKWLRTVGELLLIPKYSHWETLPALPHGRYITDSRQTLARVM